MNAGPAPTKDYRMFDPISSTKAIRVSADRHLHRLSAKPPWGIGPRSMRVADNKAGSVIALYRDELGRLYPDSEVKAITAAVFNYALGWPAVDLALRQAETLNESDLLKVYLPLKRLRSGEPLQYVLGEVQFRGSRLKVDRSVLIPRPETEELVDRIVGHYAAEAPERILDIGTGSGCIALALKKAFPSAGVFGVDTSTDALNLARENAALNGLDVSWLQADALRNELHDLVGKVDLIVSNPPYVPERETASLASNVRDFEPHIALFVPDHDPLLFHRRIAEQGLAMLSGGGQLWFEVHRQHGAEVLPMLREMGYKRAGLTRDLSGMDRFVNAER